MQICAGNDACGRHGEAVDCRRRGGRHGHHRACELGHRIIRAVIVPVYVNEEQACVCGGVLCKVDINHRTGDHGYALSGVVVEISGCATGAAANAYRRCHEWAGRADSYYILVGATGSVGWRHSG